MDTDRYKAYGAALLGDLRRCLVFLTRLPLPAPQQDEGPPPPLARSVWAFPVVGVITAFAAGAVYAAAASAGLPPFAASVLCIAALVALTGALHEDGLADVADGFGGGGDREAKLEIMRDSRIGTYGVVALALALALRIAAVAAIAGPASVAVAVIAAAAASRAAMAAVLYALPAARRDGLGAGAGRPDARGVAIAAALAFAVSLAGLGWDGAALAMVAAAAGGGTVAYIASRQVGGHTGDVLGAVQQAAEIAVLLVLAAVMARGGPAG